MSARLASPLLVAALLAVSIGPLAAKDKKKQVLPEYVLRARTVRVVVAPDSGEPLDQPMANSNARENVEKALSEWGRYQVVMDGQEADLVISVRTGNGRMVRPTIKGGPIDQRGGVAQGTDSTIRIGGAQGRAPGSDPTMSPQDQGPHMGNEIGPSRGHTRSLSRQHFQPARCPGCLALRGQRLPARARHACRGRIPQGHCRFGKTTSPATEAALTSVFLPVVTIATTTGSELVQERLP